MRLAEVAQISSESLVTQDGAMCLKVKPNAKTKASSDRIVPVAPTLQQGVELEEIAKPPEL